MNKKEILALVAKEISELLVQAELAAENAHKAAIDDQSVAETQYDTLAIESAYLAQGQSHRIDDLKVQLQKISTLILDDSKKVGIGALVELDYNDGYRKFVFLLPCGAGTKITYYHFDILVISPKAPIAQAIFGKATDDEFEIPLLNKIETGVIAAIY